MAIIDVANGQIVKKVTVGSDPAGLAVSPDSRRVYVANGGSTTVSVIDTDPASVNYNNEIRRITAGAQPTGIAVAADGRRLYVTLRGSDSVAVVDTATDAVIATVGVGDSPRSVAITPDGTQAYVANYDGRVSVISTADNSVVNQISVGSQPTSIAMGRDGTAYVANGDDTLSLIDIKTQSVFATVPLDPNGESGAHNVAVDNGGTRIYVTDAADDMLRMLAIARGNTAPQRGRFYPPSYDSTYYAVGAPDTTTGNVRGTAFFTDPERDPLTYTASTPPNGNVSVNAATGAFTYTPSQAARDHALTTAQNDTDTFTITASDGEATTSTTIEVPVAATGNVAPEWQGYTANFDDVSGSTSGSLTAVDHDGGDTVSYSLVWGPWAGSVTVTPTGGYVYTPYYTGVDGYWNYDTFYVAVTDGHYTTLGEVAVVTYTQYCGEACAL